MCEPAGTLLGSCFLCALCASAVDSFFECRNRVRRNRLTAPDFARAFIGLRFQIDLLSGYAQRFRQSRPHGREVRPQFRPLADYDRIEMRDAQLALVQQFPRVLEKQQTRRALPLWIRIRKMSADVTKSRRAKKRVAQSMR